MADHRPPGTDTDARSVLRADCSRCFGLCCVATTLTRSADFAFDKPASTPCRHLADGGTDGPGEFGCSIHDDLRPRGMPGCSTYDCFGAGQQVAQHTYGGTSWRASPGTAGQMFRVFGVVRALHEMLWLLTSALDLPSAAQAHAELAEARDRTVRLTRADAATLDGLDVDAHRQTVVPLLLRASELARAEVDGPELAGADLAGRDLHGADLRAASLRGALLIGADLRGADLRLTDVTGADLRGADVRGTDLSVALFLSQFQVNAARGDTRTTLPGGLDRPSHWHVPD